MDYELSDLVARIVQAGSVSPGDVLMLRDAVWSEEKLGRDTVDALFMIKDRCEPDLPAWTAFFIEAIEHYLLHSTQPAGFLDEGGADWLRERIDRNGRVASLDEMELLVAILESAENAPDSLKSYAIEQIERAVLTGVGPTRVGPPRPDCIDAAEVGMLRRLIFAGGGEGAVVIGAQEADMLFRLKDRTRHADNAEGWLQLFVQGVANHLMAHSDYRPMHIEEARRRHAELERAAPSLGRFFRRMVPAEMLGRGTILDSFKALFPHEEDLFAKSLAIEASRKLTDEEADWLKMQIVADGETDEYEKALLAFLIDEAGSLPTALSFDRRRRA